MKLGNFDIKHGDCVTFTDARGSVRTGKANGMLLFPTHAVLNMGGRFGTPCVVKPEQIVRVSGGRKT